MEGGTHLDPSDLREGAIGAPGLLDKDLDACQPSPPVNDFRLKIARSSGGYAVNAGRSSWMKAYHLIDTFEITSPGLLRLPVAPCRMPAVFSDSLDLIHYHCTSAERNLPWSLHPKSDCPDDDCQWSMKSWEFCAKTP